MSGQDSKYFSTKGEIPELKEELNSQYKVLVLCYTLCSDVGLAAESRSGSGEDFLGPLLHVVAEICSDFDPTLDVEPSHLKLFRNLWFYIVLFGLAPPVQKSTNKMSKTMSLILQDVTVDTDSPHNDAIASAGGEVRCKRPIPELPDINIELPVS